MKTVLWLLWAFSISEEGMLSSGWFTVDSVEQPWYHQEDCEDYLRAIYPHVLSDITDMQCLIEGTEPEGKIARWKVGTEI